MIRPPYQRPPSQTVTPRIFTDDPDGLISFLEAVFGATGEKVPGAPTEMQIGDSIVMIGDTAARPETKAFLYVYVPDTEEAFINAISVGATPIEEPTDTPYGDRRATIEDKWGNVWQIATFKS